MELLSRTRPFSIREELQSALDGKNSIFSPNIPLDLLAIIQGRLVAAASVEPFSIADWHGLTNEQYEELIRFRRALFTRVSDVGDARLIEGYRLNHDGKYEDHLGIMVLSVRQLWQYEEFRTLFPEGTTLEFAMTLCQVHDLSREVFNNSHSLPLWLVDYASEELVEQLLPGFPRENLHNIDWLFGISQPDDIDALRLVFKALDTFCKPGVDTQTFFAEGGNYTAWVRQAQPLFPMDVPLGNDLFRQVTLAEYIERDKLYTRQGLSIIGRIIDADPNEFLQGVINSYKPETQL